MRISRIHITSFGGTRDRTVRMSPGLNVIYGKNESGKTTLKSFITGTLFPDRMPAYPASKASDSGEIDIELPDGSTKTITRSGKKSNSPAPDMCGITGNEYRSIYSLDPLGLRDMGGVDSVRSRLLTVPGASAVPSAEESIDKERTSLLPDSRRSANCTVSRLRSASEAADDRVLEMNASADGDSAYGQLVMEEAHLMNLLETSKGDEAAAFEEFKESQIREGTKQNLAKIAELEKERAAYADIAIPDPFTVGKYNSLCADRRRSEEDLTKAESDYGTALETYSGPEPSVITPLAPKVKTLGESIPEYLYSRDGARRGNGVNPIVIVGAAVAVGGAAVAAMFNVFAGIGMIATGAVIAIIGLRKRPASVADPSADRTERLWKELCSGFGISQGDIRGDHVRMTSMLSAAATVSDLKNKLDSARSRLASVDADIASITDRYGGDEGYAKALEASKDIERIDAAIGALREAVPEEKIEPVSGDAEQTYMDVRNQTGDLSDRLTAIREKKKAILSDTATEEALTEAAAASGRYQAAVRRWLMLAAEKHMLETACDTLSEKNRPSVYTDADRFLTAMTGGKYGIVSDIRTSELTIENKVTGERTSVKKWSSGTEDQVKLAMKMGLTLSLTGDIPPVILDDVLMTSDDVRTEGCIRALKELSVSAQVLYFTCNSATRDMLASAGAAVTEL